MVEPKEDFEVVPNSGWGFNHKGLPRTGGIPVWDKDDIELVDLTGQEKAAFHERNGDSKFPSRIRAYGLWNVSQAQLLDSTWTPIPYRVLDDACMVFTMVLCPRGSLHGRYWPFNFDQSGRPRQTRQQIGCGIHCHYDNRQSSVMGSSVFDTKIESFLVWKRHHIFGGLEVTSLGVTEGSKDARLKLGTLDPTVWSHGAQTVPVDDSRADRGSDFALHFYFTDDGLTNNREWNYERVDVNLRGHWFDTMRRTHVIPFLLDLQHLTQPQVQLSNPTIPPQRPRRSADSADLLEHGIRKKPRNEETKAKRSQLPNRGSTRFDEMSKARQKAESITGFFLHFDEHHPEADKDETVLSTAKTKLRPLVINSIVAPWKTEENGSSSVETQQAQATENYVSVTGELREMISQLAATQALALAQQQAINKKVETFLHQLNHQPVYTALCSARDSVLNLIDAGYTSSARYIVHAIRSRLQREPALEYHFDIDQAIPELRPLLYSGQFQGASSDSGIKGSDRDGWSEDSEEDDTIEVLPDIMHL